MTVNQYIGLFGIAVAACTTMSAQASPPRGAQQLLTARGAESTRPETLSPVHSPQPYREMARTVCDQVKCAVKFSRVAAARLLEISNLSCLTIQAADDTEKFFTLSKSADVDKFQSVSAVLPATGAFGSFVGTNVSGPYYFDSGETAFVHGHSAGTGIAMICTLSGTLWRTD